MKRLICLLAISLVFAVAPAPAATEQTEKVEIFVTAWCPYCTRLESFLKDSSIPYTRYDVEKDAKGARIFSEIGGEGVPVSRVGKQVIHGYDPEGIVSALKTA